MNQIRILVVDDHSLFRNGLVGLLDEMDGIHVIGQATDGRSALNSARELDPDLILMDVHMPEMGGVEAVQALREQAFQGRILMLTVSQNEEDLLGALGAGADGYVLKNMEPVELEAAIRSIKEGLGVLSPEVTRPVLKTIRSPRPDNPPVGLSPRELEVLQLVALGDTTSQVASKLFISESTVKTHVKNILTKLEAANRAEAIHKAAQLGLL